MLSKNVNFTFIHRGNTLLEYGPTPGVANSHHATHHRRRNKVKRRKAYYSRQRRTEFTVSRLCLFDEKHIVL